MAPRWQRWDRSCNGTLQSLGLIMTLVPFAATFLFIRPEQRYPMQSPRVLRDSPPPLTGESRRILLSTGNYSCLSLPLPGLLSSQRLQRGQRQFNSFHERAKDKLTAAVESCGQLRRKPLQQESRRIACQPPK